MNDTEWEQVRERLERLARAALARIDELEKQLAIAASHRAWRRRGRMNDTDRQALNRRVLERLGWSHDKVGDWIMPDGSFTLSNVPPDYTRDANAALRDLVPILLAWEGLDGDHRLDFHEEGARVMWTNSKKMVLEYADGPHNEAVALALCLAFVETLK